MRAAGASGIALILLLAGVFLLFPGADSPVTGQGDVTTPQPTAGADRPTGVGVIPPPTGPVPDLTGYEPPPGCILDRIYEKDGWVWSEFLDKPIRPVVLELPGGERDEFPIAYYAVALNCHPQAEAINPYQPPVTTEGCFEHTLRSVDGWVVGACSGVIMPDLPVIFAGDEDTPLITSEPIGPRGGVIADKFDFDDDGH